MMLRAVGFDIDGTLYPDYRVRWRAVPFFLANARAIRVFSETRRRMRHGEHHSDGLERDSGESEVRIFSEMLGVNADAAREIRDRVIYGGFEACMRGVRPFRGVREALTRLRDSGLKLAALSDFPVGRKLAMLGLDDLFDYATGFPDSGFLKPNPGPFVHLAEMLGVEPECMVYVGNVPEYDSEGSRKAGMHSAIIGSVRGTFRGRKNHGITRFSSYRQMADSILGGRLWQSVGRERQ